MPDDKSVVKKEEAQEPRALVRGLFEKQLPEIAKALPGHLDAARFIRVALTAINQQPKLLQATRDSLLLSLMRAAQLGLECDGLLGHGYLIPRKRHGVMEAQFQPGYQGLLDLARRHKDVADVVGRVVHEKDEFIYSFGLEKDILIHKPSEEVDPGPITHAYGIVRFRDGRARAEVLSKAKMDREHRSKSQAGDDSPWKTHEEAMYLKTALIVTCKYAPKSIELARAIAIDERIEAGLAAEPEEIRTVARMPSLVSVESLGGQVTSTDNAQRGPAEKPAATAEPEKMADPAAVPDSVIDAEAQKFVAETEQTTKPKAAADVDSIFDIE